MQQLPAVEATVLRLVRYGEADLIVDVLTQDTGRLSFIARGARASKRRFAGILDLFATLRLHLQGGKNLPVLGNVDVINARLPIRDSLAQISRASILCECARLLVPEQSESRDMFRLLNRALDLVASGDLIGATQAYPYFLQVTGIYPDLRGCTRCNNRTSIGVMLDFATHGAICDSCAPPRGRLSSDAFAALKGGRPANEHVAQEMETAVTAWIETHVEKSLRSATVARQLNRPNK